MNLPLLIPALGWSLLYFVWQGLAVGALAASGLWLLRGADARARYALCALALLACVGIPLAHLLYLLAADELPEPGLSVAALTAWMPSLVLAWSAGVALMSTRLLLGLAWVARLRRQAMAAPAVWQARLDALAQRMGLRFPVPLKLHDALTSPVTVGFFRPLVLLPASLLSGMPVPLIEALLAHELAHVRRRDYLVNLLQSVAESLLFFHPVIWWLSARMRIEREQVADALAAQALQNPAQLASALHQLSLQAATRHHSHLMLSARGGTLLLRIRRLMAPTPMPGRAGWKLAVPALLLAVAVLTTQAQHQPAAAPVPAPAQLAASMLALPVNARHMLVIDDSSGKVLMAKDADTIVPIASITKLMTAMVVLDARLDPDEQLRIVRADGEPTQRHGMLADGVQVPRSVALQLALLPSENRAAAALARTYPGGRAAFDLALQAKIRSLGLKRTSLHDPVGASPANTSTATEVARIVAAAARYPEIVRITTAAQASVAVNGRSRTLRNTNALVGHAGWDIALSKTGSSQQAGSCLTMRMKSGGKHVTVVLLDADGAERRGLDAANIRTALAGQTHF